MKTIIPIIISILIIILLLKEYKTHNCKENIVITKRDTEYVYLHDTVFSVITKIKEIPNTKWIFDTPYIPSINIDTLTRQYDSLGNRYFSTKIYNSKFKIKNYGYVSITDSVSCNSLISATLIDSLNIPVITNTILQKNNFYISSGFLLSNNIIPKIGMTYSYKKNIYEIFVNYNKGFGIGFSYSYKIY
jgi:hypothetical protein